MHVPAASSCCTTHATCKPELSPCRAYWSLKTADQWLSLRLDFIGACLVVLVALLAVAERNNLSASLAALSLSEVGTHHCPETILKALPLQLALLEALSAMRYACVTVLQQALPLQLALLSQPCGSVREACPHELCSSDLQQLASCRFQLCPGFFALGGPGNGQSNWQRRPSASCRC